MKKQTASAIGNRRAVNEEVNMTGDYLSVDQFSQTKVGMTKLIIITRRYSSDR
jgi:hypothetical protein